MSQVDRREFLARSAVALSALRLQQTELKDVFGYIDAHERDHLEKLREFLRLRSVSSSGEGMMEGARETKRLFDELGFQEAEIVETPGHPAVWAYLDADAPRTLASYGMYDLVPVEGQEWSHPPFDADLVDRAEGKAVVARGANNTKGPLLAFFNAIDAVRSVRGKLPVNLMFIVEGEEELGSPHLGDVVYQYRDRLKDASAVLYAMNSQNAAGDVEVLLGNKGIAYFELVCSNSTRGQGPRRPSSSRFAPVFGNPAWRLVEALETMVDREGMVITIDGFDEGMEDPDEHRVHIDRLLERYDPDLLLAEAGADSFYPGLSKEEALARYILHPTFNISGIWSGYTGPGLSTRMPATATVKIDARLLPDMQAHDVVPRVRAHLDEHGFDDIEVRELAAVDPYRVDYDEPAVQTLLEGYRRRGFDPLVWPNMAATAPFHVFQTAGLDLPVIKGGLGHGGNNHAPDEYMVVEGKDRIAGLPEIEKFYAEFLFDYRAA